MKIAFIVEKFPAVSEPFIVDQVAGLIDRGIEVEVFSFKHGDHDNVASAFYRYNMAGLVSHIGSPGNLLGRLVRVIGASIRLLLASPSSLTHSLDQSRYGRDAQTGNLLIWSAAFVGKKFDLYHCHHGHVGSRFAAIKEILGIKEKFVTTFYGADITKSNTSYARLQSAGDMFFVMSENARSRLVGLGFDSSKTVVQPVGIKLQNYPFQERHLDSFRPVTIISAGRFVEKKGFDDLLRALAIVRDKLPESFKCVIVGDGPMWPDIMVLTDTLNLRDAVDYKGYQSREQIIALLEKADFFVQPSKTAKDGNME